MHALAVHLIYALADARRPPHIYIYSLAANVVPHAVESE